MRKRIKQDWSPMDIRHAVEKAGMNLTELARMNGLSESACRKSLRVAAPASDRVISDFLKVPLHELWPSRYDELGRRVIIHVREQTTRSRGPSQRLNDSVVKRLNTVEA